MFTLNEPSGTQLVYTEPGLRDGAAGRGWYGQHRPGVARSEVPCVAGVFVKVGPTNKRGWTTRFPLVQS